MNIWASNKISFSSVGCLCLYGLIHLYSYQMSTQSKTAPEESDYFNARNDKSPLIEGDMSPPVQPRVKSKVVVSGVRRLSTISEQDADKVDTDLHYQVPLGGNGWDESSFSLCSDKYNISSGLFSLDSHQPDSGDDCAAILLECLYCRFCDLLAMLPDTCERAVGRCFPFLKYRKAASEQEKGGDCCSCSLKLDCGCCSACQETSELLELAMEISEVCFR